MATLAVILTSLEKDEEAEGLHRRALLTLEKTLVTDHPYMFNTRQCLARSLSRQFKMDEAIEQYRLVLPLRERLLGANYPRTLMSRSGLAGCLYNPAKYDEAAQHYRVIVKFREEGSSLEDDLTTQSVARVMRDVSRSWRNGRRL